MIRILLFTDRSTWRSGCLLVRSLSGITYLRFVFFSVTSYLSCEGDRRRFLKIFVIWDKTQAYFGFPEINALWEEPSLYRLAGVDVPRKGTYCNIGYTGDI